MTEHSGIEDDAADLIQAIQDAHYADDPAFETKLSALMDWTDRILARVKELERQLRAAQARAAHAEKQEKLAWEAASEIAAAQPERGTV